MLKKVSLAILAAASVTGVAYANGGTLPPPHHTGACYVGASINGDFVRGAIDSSTLVSFADNGTSSAAGVDQSNDLSAQGVSGDLFVGYQAVFEDRYTLAAELFGSISSAKGSASQVGSAAVNGDVVVDNTVVIPKGTALAAVQSASYKLNNSVGISLLPGIKLTDSTTLYGRVGLVYSRFKFNENFGFGTVANATDVNTNDFGASWTRNRRGLQLGVGMETMVTNNVGIRGEYDWSRYGSSSKDINFGNVALLNSNTATVNPSQSIKIKPTVNQFKFGVTYHFYS